MTAAACPLCPVCDGCRDHGLLQYAGCALPKACRCPMSVREAHPVAGPLATREAQVAAHDRHANVAFDVLLAIMQRPTTRERVVALSRDRLVGIGFDQYGDAMFRQSFPELRREADEELADAVNRVVAGLERFVTDPRGSILELHAMYAATTQETQTCSAPSSSSSPSSPDCFSSAS